MRGTYVNSILFGFDAARVVDAGADYFVLKAGVVVVDVVEFWI